MGLRKKILGHRISTTSVAFTKEDMEHFRGVDWIEVHERLTLVALRMFEASRFADDERVLESFGVGFEDLPQDLITKILDPEYPKLTWNAAIRGPATTLEVTKFLSKVLQNDFLDMVRANRSKRQRSIHVPTEGEDVRLRVDPADPAAALDDDVLHRLTFAPLRKRLDDDFIVRPDDELQLYLMLQFDGERYVPYKPQDAAQELGVDVKKIYLLKEKFERRLHRLFRKELEVADVEKREPLHDQAR